MQRLLPFILLGALSLSGARAQHTDHASMPGMTDTAAPSMPVDMTDGLSKLSGPAFDRAFLSMMVWHHQAAIDMSRAVLGSAQDAQVRGWAQGVITAQQREIGQMKAWLKGLGGLEPAAQADMMKDMQNMVAAVRRTPTDRAFVSGMLTHHGSAISMATTALTRSGDARVLGLARDIVRAQASELYDYRQWLLKHHQ